MRDGGSAPNSSVSLLLRHRVKTVAKVAGDVAASVLESKAMNYDVHVLGVRIRNFRSIRQPLELKFVHPSGSPLSRVVLAGQNGAGKTTILEAILLALGMDSLITRDLPAPDRRDHWRAEIPEGAEIELQLRMTGGQYSFIPPFSPDTKQFTVRRTASDWDITFLKDDGKSEYVDSDDIGRLLSTLSVEYFSSWRAPILSGAMQPSARGRFILDNEANRLRRLKQRIINERARKAFGTTPGQALDEVWLERINDVWRAFHRDGTYLAPGVVESGEDEGLFDLFVLESEGERRCSIDQLSSGEIELLTIAGSLILSSFSGLLLIDEPELHLHREWQRQLLDVLSKTAPHAQLIVATHADAPWDQVYSFERFFLARPGDPRSNDGLVDGQEKAD